MTDTVENQTQTDDNIPVPVEVLNVQDLVDIANLIDVVTQRGAFRADELSAAGALYDKLKTFLATLMPKEETSTEENKVEGTYEFKGE